MTKYKIKKAIDKKDLSEKAAQDIASIISSTLETKDRCQISLSGGSTPADTYLLLSRMELPWSKIDIFLGDERWVDNKDESSNSLMINRTLLSSDSSSKARFYPIPFYPNGTPMESAQRYSKLIEDICDGNPPSFDLTLLGLGDDGHTASLFPSSDALYVTNKWVTVSNGKGLDRITITSPVLNSSKKVIFLVSGKSKQIAIKRLLDEKEDVSRTPARIVQPLNTVMIIADEASVQSI